MCKFYRVARSVAVTDVPVARLALRGREGERATLSKRLAIGGRPCHHGVVLLSVGCHDGGDVDCFVCHAVSLQGRGAGCEAGCATLASVHILLGDATIPTMILHLPHQIVVLGAGILTGEHFRQQAILLLVVARHGAVTPEGFELGEGQGLHRSFAVETILQGGVPP